MRKRIVLLIIAALLALPGAHAAEEENAMQLLAVNVGKADALLLRCGTDTWLIDAGTWQSWPVLSRALRVNQVEHLTGVILTHTDKDHIGGVWALAQTDIAIDGWYSSAFCEKYTEQEHPVVLAAALRGQKVQWLHSGDTLPLDGGSLTVLGPTVYDDKENNNSVVLLAECGGGTMLLAGDMEIPEEQLLMAAGLIRQADVLKVGNHGNKDATSDSFAALVSPKLAVISTDTAEDDGTAHKRVLQALKNTGAQIVITQNAPQGVEVTLSGGEPGCRLLDWPELPAQAAGISLSAKDYKADTVTLSNSGDADVPLGGWFILSAKGKQTYVFPSDTIMRAGAALTVSSLSTETAADLVWPESGVWKKSEDTASLYDPYGRLISEIE